MKNDKPIKNGKFQIVDCVSNPWNLKYYKIKTNTGFKFHVHIKIIEYLKINVYNAFLVLLRLNIGLD